VHVISPPGRLSVPNVCACVEFAVSRLRSQFARLAKDTAIVGLPLNRGAEECLPNGECSLPRGVTVVLGLAAPHGQAAGVAEDPTGTLRCIMGIELKSDGVTGASQGAMSCQQGPTVTENVGPG
jgi:hypothetical protein